MKVSPVCLVGGVVALVCVAIGIYYLIPSKTAHFLGKANVSDYKHSIVFFVIAVVAMIGARFVANSKSA